MIKVKVDVLRVYSIVNLRKELFTFTCVKHLKFFHCAIPKYQHFIQKPFLQFYICSEWICFCVLDDLFL